MFCFVCREVSFAKSRGADSSTLQNVGQVIKAKEGLCVSGRAETPRYHSTLHDMGLLSSFLFSKQCIFVLKTLYWKGFPPRSEGRRCTRPAPRDVNGQSFKTAAAQQSGEAERRKAAIRAPFSLDAAAASWITAREQV